MDFSRGHSRSALLIIQGQIEPSKTGGAVVLVEGLALVTAVSNAVSALLISKGMRGSDALSAALISTSVQAAILSTFLLFRIPG